MEWTESQRKVIETKDKDILVSAAAGSGKTAVLVERIIRKVTDKNNPVNVDQMLIVTFTKAAAAQMREKIHNALEKEAAAHPDNAHLARQLNYVRSAQITTIDGFCTYLLKNYYDTIDLNPGFRVADESELKIVKTELIKKVLGDWYEKAALNPDEEESRNFLDAVDSCQSGSSDEYMEDIVLKLYDIAASHVNPTGWISRMVSTNQIRDIDGLDKLQWVEAIGKILNIILQDNIRNCEMAVKICGWTGGPAAYKETLLKDIEIYKKFSELKSYNEIYSYMQEYSFPRIKAIRKTEPVDEELKELVKQIRGECKKSLEGIKKRYFFMSPQRMLSVNNLTVHVLLAVARVTMDFADEFTKYKEDKNILDFSDIEHYALKILTVDGSAKKPSDVAAQLSDFYDEIFIDEYQDSNDVQEEILTSIAGRRQGKPHMFMVGDVKQSIYGFRMAKPDLFIEKSESYSAADDGDNIRIDLHKNFRSTGKVLELCNYIFERSMTKLTGKIEYDEDEKLFYGARYDKLPCKSDNCELLIYNTHKDEEALSVKEEGISQLSKTEAELRMIAARIRQIVDTDTGMKVTETDNDGNQYLRSARYEDIVILFRGISSWLDIINDVFTDEGIPIMVENTAGYFSAVEIRVMLNLLRIVNNPLQDIPMVSVLRSPIGMFTNEEIAILRSSAREDFVYDNLKGYVQDGKDEGLIHKINDFLEMLGKFRRLSDYMSIHELILKIYDDTGYYDCVMAMNDGKRRRMNLDMLVARAAAFEKTSYNGLFNFVRFMDKMTSYTIDYGQAGNDGAEDCVRIMTIHKSKGLEFPIVFVAGMGKSFNRTDTKNKIVIHQNFGLGIDYINHEHRIRIKTLSKAVLSKMIDMENIDEELRILYVALTRAKEKLIMTGFIDFENAVGKNSLLESKDMQDRIPGGRILSLKSYMELVIMSLMRTRQMAKAMDEASVCNIFMEDMTNDCPIDIKVFDEEDIKNGLAIKQLTDSITADAIRNFDTSIVYNEETRGVLEKLDKLRNYVPVTNIKSKKSVSELKMQAMLESEELDNHTFGEGLTHMEKLNNKMTAPVSEPLKRGPHAADINKPSGARIGTMYHKMFEILPLEEAIEYAKLSDDKLRKYLDKIALGYSVLDDWEGHLEINKIRKFLKSDLAHRMCAAGRKGNLRREQQFVLGIEEKGEQVLIQGIIDAYFIENGEVVLLDYKTDRVGRNDGEDILKNRYMVQLDWYKKAIERATGLNVKEIVIYSTSLGREIRL